MYGIYMAPFGFLIIGFMNLNYSFSIYVILSQISNNKNRIKE